MSQQEQVSATDDHINAPPSKLAANATYALGVAQEQTGALLGHQGLKEAGVINKQKGNEDYEAAQRAAAANAPSQLHGNLNVVAGATKEHIGSILGASTM